MITNKQYNELKPLFRYLYTSANADYIVGITTAESQKLFQLYNEIFNKNETTTQCTRCRIRICKLLYSVYIEKEQALNKTKTEKPKPTKKTTTAKKKK